MGVQEREWVVYQAKTGELGISCEFGAVWMDIEDGNMKRGATYLCVPLCLGWWMLLQRRSRET